MKQKLLIIAGPTGVGKTELSIKLAKLLNGEVISADSMQIYKYMDIGSAKVTKDEMQGVKHYLIDFLDPISEYSIKDFQDDARKIIDSLDCVPLIVGGSGLYVDALVTDYDLSVDKRSETIEDKYLELTNEEHMKGVYKKLIDKSKMY